jgi:transposase InsO family protein
MTPRELAHRICATLCDGGHQAYLVGGCVRDLLLARDPSDYDISTDARPECLDAHWFATLAEAKQIIEAWRREYNKSRPHRALGERTPNEFASEFAASRELTGPPTAENSLSG